MPPAWRTIATSSWNSRTDSVSTWPPARTSPSPGVISRSSTRIVSAWSSISGIDEPGSRAVAPVGVKML
jgi:hypothetical protein